MNWFDAIPVVGDLLKNVFGLIDQAVEDKDAANAKKAETAQALFRVLTGGGIVEKNWRGVAMLFVAGTVCYDRIAGNPLDYIFLALLVVGLVGYQVTPAIEFLKQLKPKKGGDK